VVLGKILDDNSKTVEACGIKDGGLVIIMLPKAKPAKKEAAKEAPKPTVSIDGGAQPTATEATPPTTTAPAT
jgi:hypothetical protein